MPAWPMPGRTARKDNYGYTDFNYLFNLLPGFVIIGDNRQPIINIKLLDGKDGVMLRRGGKLPALVAAVISLAILFLTASPLLAAVKYTVKSGDSLYAISKKHGTTVNAIKRENGLTGDRIYPGQIFRIPGGSTASRGSGYSQDDLYWLARTVYGEARGEPYMGQVAVAAVILNRVDSLKFPNTIKGVIFQPLAFTAVADGQIYLQPNATAIKAARAALNGQDPTGGALYYWNPAKATSKWIWSRTIVTRIGNHVFGY